MTLCDPYFTKFGERSMTGAAGQQRVTKDFIHGYQIAVPALDIQRRLAAELQREQATLAGLVELRAKFEAKIAARLAAVWGEAPAAEPPARPKKIRDSKPQSVAA